MKRPILWIFLIYICMILLMRQYNVVSFSDYRYETQIFEGIVRDVSITRTGRQSILFVSDDGLRIQCLLYTNEPISLGQRVTLKGRLMDFELPENRGDFNEWLYYTKQKIDYKMFPEVVETGDIEKHFFVYIGEFRQKLIDIYDDVLPPTESGIIKSMIIGHRTGLTDEIRELYAYTGIVHILAISGMHVSILLGSIYFVLKHFKLNKRIVSICGILFLIFYTILTGASVATVRAAIMHGVYLIGNIFYKDNDGLSAVSFAGLLMLIYEPLYLFDIGFQFSFVAVFALIILTAPTERAIIHMVMGNSILTMLFRNAYMIKYLSGCLVASIATLPITVYYFQYIPVYSVLSNLVIVSNVSILIVIGFIIPIVGFFSTALATFVAAPVYYLLQIYEFILELIIQLPYAVIEVEYIDMFIIILYYVSLILFGYFMSTKRFVVEQDN